MEGTMTHARRILAADLLTESLPSLLAAARSALSGALRPAFPVGRPAFGVRRDELGTREAMPADDRARSAPLDAGTSWDTGARQDGRDYAGPAPLAASSARHLHRVADAIRCASPR
jgi:hypothetical protein